MAHILASGVVHPGTLPHLYSVPCSCQLLEQKVLQEINSSWKGKEYRGADLACSVCVGGWRAVKLNVNPCLCQVALLVQFLIENSGEIFGGDIASLFQRPDKKTSKNSEDSLGKFCGAASSKNV